MIFWLGLVLPVSAEWQYSGTGVWAPADHLVNGSLSEVAMDAKVSKEPPRIDLRFFKEGSYTIFRKSPDQGAVTDWRVVGAVNVSVAPTIWTDTNVEVGKLYEYGVGGAGTERPGLRGNLIAGIEADRTLPRGRMAVVVAEDVIQRLPEDYAQYVADLELDGWVVHQIVTSRAADYRSNGLGAPDAEGVPTAPFPDAHIQIRNQLMALYNQYPGELKNVVLVGRVPVARSGIDYLGPDGHGNKMSAGADAYYADMDGVWTDVGNNLALYSGSTRDYGVEQGLINVAGDNKFDQTNIKELTPNQRIEIGFGRIDTSNRIPGEFDALRTYFRKLHRYKTASPDFQPGRKAVFRINAPLTAGEVQKTFMRSIPGVVGMENVILLKNSDASGSGRDEDSFSEEDRDAVWTRLHGPVLFYFKGSGVPDRSTGSKAVFWTGLQSGWGWWYMPDPTSEFNAMALRIGEENMTLSYTWSIWGPEYLYHRLGMGGDIGDVMRVSMSDRYFKRIVVGTGEEAAVGSSAGASSETLAPPSSGGMDNGGGISGPNPTPKPTPIPPTYQYIYPVYETSDGPVFSQHMGCPSLRLFMFEPPSDLSVVPSGGHPSLAWVPSPNAEVTGYHVYRSQRAGGPYERVTISPISGTTYEDASVSSGTWHYMVRAVRLETCGGGTFWNASLGVRQAVDLDNMPSAPQVVAAALPDARWAQPYSFALSATGGTPLFTWGVIDGGLPPGITLSPKGVLSGQALVSGDFVFTVRATDHFGQTALRELVLKVLPESAQVLYADAFQSVNVSNDRGSSADSALNVSGPYYKWTSLVRFDLSGMEAHNTAVRARLVLTGGEKTNEQSYGLVKAALSQVGSVWDPVSLTYAALPPDEPGLEAAGAPYVVQRFATVEFDVTDQVLKVLREQSAQELTFRLFSTTPAGFGDEIKFVTRYASGDARPRLIIETSDAPRIVFETPSSSPAAIPVGEALQIRAAVTPVPARTGSVTVHWEQVQGPGAAVLGMPSQAETTATFPVAGDYTLRLTATDGVLSTARDLQVRVLEVPGRTAAAYGPTNGLVLRVPLDETAGVTTAAVAPGAGTVVTGTLATINTPATLPTWELAGGKIGGAVRLDGTRQRVEIPDSEQRPLDGLGKMTLSAWIKMESHAGLSTAILVKRTSNSSSTTSYALTLNASRKLSATIGTAAVNSTGQNALEVGRWYHVAMVFDGEDSTTNVRVYLDGMPEIFGKIPATSISRRATTPLRIGDYTTVAPANTASFSGLIDEVRVYNRALSLEEITDLYRAAPANLGPRIVLDSQVVSGTAGQPVAVGATVTDDGKPAALQVHWVKGAGPGTVVFSDPVAPDTTATAAAPGDYKLRVFANDGDITTWADVAAAISAGSGGIAAWRERYFGTSENTGEAADTANPAADGLKNLLKYALGLNPMLNYSGSGAAPRSTLQEIDGSDRMVFTFTRDAAVSDVGLVVEVTGNLAGGEWTEIDPLDPQNQVSVQENTPVEGIQTITVKDTEPFSPSGRRFMRLKVKRP